MKLTLRKFLLTAAATVAALAIGGGSSQAGPVNGSIGMAAILPTLANGTNLGNTTQINILTWITTGFGTMDYAPIPITTPYGTTPLDLTSLATFTISNASWGTFAASTGMIVQQTASFLDVYLMGTYTPGPLMVGVDPGPTSFRISFNQSGASISGAATLSSPPAPLMTPEPATLVSGLLALPLVGGLWLRRRKMA